MRAWLHQHEGAESGWNAWSLEYLGFSTWAPSREGVLQKTPGKLGEYLQWLAGHRPVSDQAYSSDVLIIIEEVRGDEPLFRDDLSAATPEEISYCIELLQYTRRNLLDAVETLPNNVLDWIPSGHDRPDRIWWRTIRLILKHIALTELGYYLPWVIRPMITPEYLTDVGWCRQLRLSRKETIRCLEELKSSEDRTRLIRGSEEWSLRKVLRRLVWHELVHWKSIKRIIKEYAEQNK